MRTKISATFTTGTKRVYLTVVNNSLCLLKLALCFRLGPLHLLELFEDRTVLKYATAIG